MRIQTLSTFISSELEQAVTSTEHGRSSTHMVQTPLFTFEFSLNTQGWQFWHFCIC